MKPQKTIEVARDGVGPAVLLAIALATALQVSQPQTVSAANGCTQTGNYCTDSYCTLGGGYCYVGIGSGFCDCIKW